MFAVWLPAPASAFTVTVTMSDAAAPEKEVPAAEAENKEDAKAAVKRPAEVRLTTHTKRERGGRDSLLQLASRPNWTT